MDVVEGDVDVEPCGEHRGCSLKAIPVASSRLRGKYLSTARRPQLAGRAGRSPGLVARLMARLTSAASDPPGRG